MSQSNHSSNSSYAQFANGAFIILLICFLIFGTILIFSDSPSPKNLDPDGKSFIAGWKSDLEKMKQEQLLPKDWDQIHQVHITNQSEHFKKWISNIENPIHENPKGSKILDIVVITWEESGVMAAIFQYSLFDKATNNLDWEIARTIYIRGSLEQYEKLTD